MRLHRSISPDRPLIVVALESEAAHLHLDELPILVTGVGKVNAAVAVAATLGQASPSYVINMGTAGALRDDVSGVHVIGRVIQHDLNDAGIYELTGIHPGLPIDLAEGGSVLATGDRFISNPEVRARLAEQAQLVDMEGYAVARAATALDVPVMMVKAVSDSAGSAAAESWVDAVDRCSRELGAWLRAHLDLAG